MSRTLLVYRDRIIPRSEALFMRRQYAAFERLRPYWIGRHLGDGLDDLGAEAHLLGRAGALGAIEREAFKVVGRLPAEPDLRALNPALVHAHFGRGGALALPIAEQLGLPLVVSFHGGDATKETHYRARLIPTIYQRRLDRLKARAALFVCVSAFIRERLLERGFPAEKLRVIRYGIDAPPTPDAARPPAPDTILFAGRFVDKKGIPVLIAAVRRLVEQGWAPRLVLIGDGPARAAVNALAAGLADCEVAGWLPNAEVRARMSQALAVVVPSVEAASGDAEGLPNVVLEAMAAGAPVVGSRHAGIGEAVEDGVTGLLVPPNDVEALTAALRRLLLNPAEREAMAAAAKKRAIAEFSVAAQSRLLETTLLDAAG